MLLMSIMMVLFSVGVMVVFPGLAKSALHYLSNLNVPTGSNIIVFPIVSTINSEKSLFVTPEDIRTGKFLGGTVTYQDLKTSMLYHMRDKRYSAMCAQHVGVPIQYCILDEWRVLANGSRLDPSIPLGKEWLSEPYITELFNPVLDGWSENRLDLVQERNVFCPHEHWVLRFRWIWVKFLMAPSGDMSRLFYNGTHAYNIQHFLQIHKGMKGCMENSAEELAREAYRDKMQYVLPADYRNALPAPPSIVVPEPIVIPDHNKKK